MFSAETCLNSTNSVATLAKACTAKCNFHQSVRENRREGKISAISSTQFMCNDSNQGEFKSFEYHALELKAKISAHHYILSATTTPITFSIGILRTDLTLYH